MSTQESSEKGTKQKSAKQPAVGRRVLVRQTRGLSGRGQDTLGTMRALGLGRIGQSREVVINPAVAGMIRKVSHLVVVESV